MEIKTRSIYQKKSRSVHLAYERAISKARPLKFRETREIQEHSRRYLGKSILSAVCVIVGIACAIGGLWVAWILAAVGAGYETVSHKILPPRCKKEVGERAIYISVLSIILFVGHVMLGQRYWGIQIIVAILCIFLLVNYFSLINRYFKESARCFSGQSELPNRGQDYSHPCQGQCDNPAIILEKSPTPKYKHNCRAPCATVTRGGQDYKKKQRKRT